MSSSQNPARKLIEIDDLINEGNLYLANHKLGLLVFNSGQNYKIKLLQKKLESAKKKTKKPIIK